MDTSCNSKSLSIGTVYKSVSCISLIKSWSGHYTPSSRPIAARAVGRNGQQGKDKAKGQQDPTASPFPFRPSAPSSGRHKDPNLVSGSSY